MTDDKVNPEKGTGVVMCATFGDSTDLEWYEEHRLPIVRLSCLTAASPQMCPLLAVCLLKPLAKIIEMLAEETFCGKVNKSAIQWLCMNDAAQKQK